MDKMKTVEGQLKAYNDHDFEKYLSYYTDDVVGYDLDKDKVLFRGKDEMREAYRPVFSQATVFCEIESRMILGNTVIDFEQIYKGKRKVSRAIALYELDGHGFIKRMIMTRGGK